MAGVGGAQRNWLVDFYNVGFLIDQASGLALALLVMGGRELLLLMWVAQFFTLAVALFALLPAREVLAAGLDKRLLVLPAYHLGGLAVMSVLGHVYGAAVVQDEVTQVGSPMVLGASVLHSAVGLVGGLLWLYWSRQDGRLDAKVRPLRAATVRPAGRSAPAPRPAGTASIPARAIAPPMGQRVAAPSAMSEPRTQTIPRLPSPKRVVASGPPTLAPGAIKAAVEANDGGSLLLAQIGLALALLILGLNWKYFYNVARGPQVITGALLQAPGATRAVRSEAPALLAIEETSSASVRVGRRRGLRRIGVPLPDTKTFFYVGKIDEQWVLVRSSEESPMIMGFSGELVGAPESIVAELKKNGDWGDIQWMVDVNSNYRTPGFWSSVGLLLLAGAGYKAVTISSRVRGGFTQSPVLAHLRTLGPIPAVVQRIEREINGFGPSAQVGKWWVTPQWIVTLDPEIAVTPVGTLVAAAPIADVDSKTKELKRAGIGLWTKSGTRRTSLWIEPKEILPVAQAIVERLPWAWVSEAGPFEDRWKGDRDGCVREAESRYRAHQRAAATTVASLPTVAPAEVV